MLKRKRTKQQYKDTTHMQQCQRGNQPTPASLGLSQVQHWTPNNLLDATCEHDSTLTHSLHN